MTTAPSAQARRPLSPFAEGLVVWAIAFGSILIAYLLLREHAAVAAVVAFLYLPLYFMRKRNEDYRDFGVTLAHWRQDLKWFALLFAIVAPLYLGGYLLYPKLLAELPPSLARHLSPYSGVISFHPRLPDRFWEWVITHFLVTALPEEFFYRGYLLSRFKERWPDGRRIFGVTVGRAFLLSAVLFAIGHLAIFQFWRLGVFFPALLFGWLREKTGTILGATLLHGTFNLYELVLKESLIGPP